VVERPYGRIICPGTHRKFNDYVTNSSVVFYVVHGRRRPHQVKFTRQWIELKRYDFVTVLMVDNVASVYTTATVATVVPPEPPSL